jgi:citrate (Re)-synthase
MLRVNKFLHTLEKEDYTYDLKDVDKPELYRHIFPYSEPPRITFNHRIVPMIPPEDIWITDTTFRDGQQSRQPFTVKQIVELFTLLHRLGGPHGIIKQTEFFLYTDKDKEAVRKCMEKGYQFPEITGWIRAVKDDFKLVKNMGIKETGILTSCSDYHIFLKLKKRRREAMEDYLDVVRAALEEGIVPRCHLEDITRADYYGFVIPFAQALMALSAESKIPIKIRICDTMGFGLTYPGVDLPRSVKGLVYGFRQFAGVPSEYLEWHGHNDFYRALNNATTAWLYGSCAANGTLLGLGERCGNPPLEGLVFEYIGLKGVNNGIDTTIITEIANYFRHELGVVIPPHQPFIGADFNVTRAGIHADGLLKDEEIYNVFDTEKILKRPVEVAIADKSGAAGIAHWVNKYFGLTKNQMVSKDDPRIQKIKKWVDSQYSRGRTTSISKEEMQLQTKKYFKEKLGKRSRKK